MRASELPSFRASELPSFPFLLALTLFASSESQAAYVRELYAPEVYLEYVNVPTGSQLIAYTYNLSTGADSVIHLFVDNGAAGFTQVGYNDNYNGALSSRITYTNLNPSWLRFLLVIRSKYTSNGGQTAYLSVLVGGQYKTMAVQIPLGMGFHDSTYLPRGPSYKLYSVEKPGGSTWPFLACFTTVGDTTIAPLALTGGVGGGVEIPAKDASSPEYCRYYLLGTPRIRDELGVEHNEARVGYARLIVNDTYPMADSDGDGLCDALEAELLTCYCDSACSYAGTVHAYDTDRDGLLDGDEVLGRAGDPALAGADDLPFYRYGANPLQKDVFVEVDYMEARGADPFAGQTPAYMLDWVDDMRAAYLAGPASHLKNPNGQNGVLVHLDLAAQPAIGVDESKYADWGSVSERKIFSRRRMKLYEPLDGYLWMKVGAAAWEVLTVDGTVSVEDIIAYFKDYVDNDCDQTTGVTKEDDDGAWISLAIASDAPTAYPSVQTAYWERATATWYFEPFINGVLEVFDEDANDMRRRWRGDYDGDYYMSDSIRHDRFHYALINKDGGGQSSAPGDNIQVENNRYALAHELGHNTGIVGHAGHVSWGAEGLNCIPHYLSMMNYAFIYNPDYNIFSASEDGFTLNPENAYESNAIPGLDTGYLADPPFGLEHADTTHVDWDRNGYYNSSYSIKAITNLTEAGSKDCGTFAAGIESIATDTVASGAVDLVRDPTSNRLFAFYVVVTGVGETEIRYRSALLGAQSNSSCTGSSNPTEAETSPCLTWEPERVLTDATEEPQGLSAVAYAGHVFVAYRDENSFLHIRRYNRSGTTLNSDATQYVLSTTEKDPEMVVIYENPAQGWTQRLAILWAPNFNDRYYMAYSNPDGNNTWVGSAAQVDANGGAYIVGETSPAAVSWPDPFNTYVPQANRTACALFPATNGQLRFYCRDNSSANQNQWINLTTDVFGSATALPDPAPGAKPSLAYRLLRCGGTDAPVSKSSNLGSFVIGFEHGVEHAPYIAVTTPIYLYPITIRPQVKKTHTYLRNHWLDVQTGTSLALYDDSTMGGMMALQPTLVDGDYEIYFLPHADGSPNQTMSIYSDYKVMEDGICRGLIGSDVYLKCGPEDVENWA